MHVHNNFCLKIGHLNIRSLAKHFDETAILMQEHNFDFLGLSETWLSNKNTNRSIQIKNYKLIRSDRDSHAGGVCLYFRSNLKVKKLSSGSCGKVEFLASEFESCFGTMLILVIYNPSPVCRNDIGDIQNIFEKHLSNYNRFIGLGDFNYNMLADNQLSTYFRINNLYFLPFSPTRLNNLLDLIICFEPDKHNVLSYGQLAVPALSDHDLIFACYKFFRIRDQISYSVVPDYNSIDCDYFTNCFYSLNWSTLYNLSDVNVILDEFNNRFLHLESVCLPWKRSIKKCPTVPWLNVNILNLMERRDRAYKIYKWSGLEVDLNSYKQLRNQVTSSIYHAKQNFYFRSSYNSKHTWNNLKKLGVSSTISDAEIDFSADEILASITRSDVSSGVMPLADNCFAASVDDDTFSFQCVDELTILNAINSIKSDSKAYDRIDFKMLKLFVDLFLPQIKFIINQCLTKSVFPDSWKVASVIPLPKKDVVSGLGDIRPISILPALSKVLEKIMQLQMLQHANSHNYFCKFQSGYKPGHGTTTALVHIVDDLSALLDSTNSFAILVLLDFSKAFDSVNHMLLLQKLYLYYKFSTSAVRLIHSYLHNRKQFVKHGDTYSEIQEVVAGVPQGSILGPLLFSMYINDLPWKIQHCKFHLFADDLQLYIGGHISELSVIVAKVNADLQNTSLWAKNNSLALNPNKSKALFLSRNKSLNVIPLLYLDNYIISYVSTVKNLGLIMNSSLSWNDHVSSLCQKVNYSLYTLRFIKSICPVNLRIYLVKSLILPIFTYCDIIFNKCDSISRRLLETTFNNCTRYVHDIRKFDHISEYRNSILGCDLFQLYYHRTAMFIFRIINSETPIYLFEKLKFSRSLRTRNINLPAMSCNVYRNSGLINAIITWNSIPPEVRNITSISKFKKEIVSLLNNQTCG